MIAEQVQEQEPYPKTPSKCSPLRFLLVTVATTAVGFGLICVVVNIPAFDFRQHYSTLATTAFGVAGLGAYLAVARNKWRWIMATILAICAAFICIGLTGIITGRHYLAQPLFFAPSCFVWPPAMFVVWFGLLGLGNLIGWREWVRSATRLCLILLVLVPFTALLCEMTGQFNFGIAILLGCSGIGLASVAALGTILVAILSVGRSPPTRC